MRIDFQRTGLQVELPRSGRLHVQLYRSETWLSGGLLTPAPAFAAAVALDVELTPQESLTLQPTIAQAEASANSVTLELVADGLTMTPTKATAGATAEDVSLTLQTALSLAPAKASAQATAASVTLEPVNGLSLLPSQATASATAADVSIELQDSLSLSPTQATAGATAEDVEMEPASGPTSVLDDVLSYYGFEDSPGFLVDFKGVANLSNTGTVQDATGFHGESAAGFFDGSGDSLRRSGTYTAGQLTLAGWFLRTSTTNNQALFDLTNDDRIFIRNTDQFVFRAKSGASNAEVQINGVATYFPTGTWTHFVFVFDGVAGTHTVYINGVNRGSAAGAGSTVTGTLYIGNLSGGSWQWTGEIDEVAIWNRALSSSEVTELYNGGTGLFP